MKALFDRAEDLLALPVWTNLHVARDAAADLIKEAEALAGGDCSDSDLRLISDARGLSQQLLERFKSEHRRLQMEGIGESKRDWNNIPDPAQRIIRGTPMKGNEPYMEPRTQGNQRSYASLFGPVPPSPFSSAAEFFGIVGNAQHHPALISAAGLGETGVGELLVPVEYEARMIDFALHQSIVLPRAAIEPMVSRQKIVGGLDGQNQSNSLSPYGLTFAWLVENQDTTPGTASVRALELTARPLGCYVQASNEIYADSGQLEQLLTEAMGTGIAEAMDHHFLRGTGAGVPLGVLNSQATLAVSKVSGQTAATLVLRNVLDILSRHSSPNSAVWVVSPTVLPSLFTQTITIGDGGSHVPLVQIAPGQNGQQQLYMLGRPLFQSHRMPALGTVGDIGLYDFNYYYVGLRQGTAIERSAHAGFTANSQVWRCVARFDGQPRLSQAMTGADGNTYSPFVVVETRS